MLASYGLRPNIGTAAKQPLNQDETLLIMVGVSFFGAGLIGYCKVTRWIDWLLGGCPLVLCCSRRLFLRSIDEHLLGALGVGTRIGFRSVTGLSTYGGSSSASRSRAVPLIMELIDLITGANTHFRLLKLSKRKLLSSREMMIAPSLKN